jgi:hypothetical protein
MGEERRRQIIAAAAAREKAKEERQQAIAEANRIVTARRARSNMRSAKRTVPPEHIATTRPRARSRANNPPVVKPEGESRVESPDADVRPAVQTKKPEEGRSDVDNAEKIARRRHRAVQLTLQLAKENMSPEQIAQKTGQSLRWVKLTLEDFEQENVTRKRRTRTTETSKKPQDAPSQPNPPNNKTAIPSELSEEFKGVLAHYRKIRETFKAGNYTSIEEFAKIKGLDYKLTHRVITGNWPE